MIEPKISLLNIYFSFLFNFMLSIFMPQPAMLLTFSPCL